MSPRGSLIVIIALPLPAGLDHARRRINAVIVYFRKDQLLLEPEGKIAASIEAPARQTAKIAHARQRHRNQPIEKLVHALPAQRDLAPDLHSLAQLESRDRPL